MSSFKSAVEVGAHAIETDVRLSADGVVVLSHVCIFSRGLSFLLLDHPVLILPP